METTPNQITVKIIELCSKVVPGAVPVFVEVATQEYAIENDCFNNVNEMVHRNGGKSVPGWSVWQWDNILVEAEAHAVWRSPSGQMIDITPHINKEKRILFLPDDQVSFNGYPINSIRMQLTDSPLIAELIQIKEWLFSIVSTYPAYENITLEDAQAAQYRAILYRHDEIIMALHKKTERNDPCPCQSGLKYKKCCGQ